MQDVAPILALLAARLKQRESDYAELFDVLLGLSQSDVAMESVSLQIAHEARDDTPQALDAVWEEEQVKFVAEQGVVSLKSAAISVVLPGLSLRSI